VHENDAFVKTSTRSRPRIYAADMTFRVRAFLLCFVAIATSTMAGVTSPATAAPGWSSISPGSNDTCGIRAHLLHCWGNNDYGKTGDSGFHNAPFQIGTYSSWSSVSAADYTSCGLRAGRIYCWGTNTDGQLGNGTFDTPSPNTTPRVIASTYTDWKSVSTRGRHACGIRVGLIYCWGYNSEGQLGDNSHDPENSPHLIASSHTDWTGVSAGSGYTCATRAGRIYCWGGNSSGQLGDNSHDPEDSPHLIASSHADWTAVAAGSVHTCGIRVGRIYCWGANFFGELGDGTTSTGRTYPRLVAGSAADWTSVSANGEHTCATRVGRIYCWGHNNFGQLGLGTTKDWHYPKVIASTNTDWSMVRAGGSHTCGIRATLLYCWGNNTFGQLGDGTSGDGNDRHSPKLITG
jgi:alpha-tubulin suppressor-like RCC1 family protein